MEKKICKCCGKLKPMLSGETMCYQCRINKEVTDAKEAIAEGEEPETGSSHWVICPYCGEGMDVCYGCGDFPELYEEGEHDIECPECGRMFIMETTISYYYETRKK